MGQYTVKSAVDDNGTDEVPPSLVVDLEADDGGAIKWRFVGDEIELARAALIEGAVAVVGWSVPAGQAAKPAADAE